MCLPERIYSYEICRRLVRAAACGPFDEAIGFIEEMAGVNVPKASAYQIAPRQPPTSTPSTPAGSA